MTAQKYSVITELENLYEQKEKYESEISFVNRNMKSVIHEITLKRQIREETEALGKYIPNARQFVEQNMIVNNCYQKMRTRRH